MENNHEDGKRALKGTLGLRDSSQRKINLEKQQQNKTKSNNNNKKLCSQRWGSDFIEKRFGDSPLDDRGLCCFLGWSWSTVHKQVKWMFWGAGDLKLVSRPSQTQSTTADTAKTRTWTGLPLKEPSALWPEPCGVKVEWSTRQIKAW